MHELKHLLIVAYSAHFSFDGKTYTIDGKTKSGKVFGIKSDTLEHAVTSAINKCVKYS